MKSEKGITLLSLIIYIILLVLVVSMLSIISSLFFSNTNIIKDNSKNIAEFNKFNMYFIEDVKNNTNTYEVTPEKIVFEDGTVYTYKKDPDTGIYRNKVKICNNIGYCYFSKQEKTVNNFTKQIINVHMIIKGSKIFETTNNYVLKYW